MFAVVNPVNPRLPNNKPKECYDIDPIQKLGGIIYNFIPKRPIGSITVDLKGNDQYKPTAKYQYPQIQMSIALRIPISC